VLRIETNRFFDFFFLVIPLMAFCLSFSVSFSYQYPIGVELNPEYVKIARNRLAGVAGRLDMTLSGKGSTENGAET